MKIEARLQRETKSLLREFLSKASRIRFKTGFAKQIKSPIQKMESQGDQVLSDTDFSALLNGSSVPGTPSSE